jgi:hypothetical protein
MRTIREGGVWRLAPSDERAAIRAAHAASSAEDAERAITLTTNGIRDDFIHPPKRKKGRDDEAPRPFEL